MGQQREDSERNMCGRRDWWWFTFLCFAAATSISCAKQTNEQSVLVYPEGDVFVEYGDNLTLLCYTIDNTTSEDLVFSLNDANLTSTAVNSTTRMFFAEKPEPHSNLNYYCTNSKTGRNQIVTVTIGSKPKNVKSFQCKSYNLMSLNCSWETPDLTVNTKYSLAYTNNGKKTKECNTIEVLNSLTRYCELNSTTTPMYRQLFNKYHFVLEAHNNFGNNSEKFDIDHYRVVKPAKPENLKFSNATPHSVVLQWKLSSSIADFLKPGVVHKIEYQIAKIDNTSYFRQVDTSILSPKSTNGFTFNLDNLPYAHMQYGVRVYVKPVHATDEFWSEPSKLPFYTASERPRRPPETIAGAFRQNLFTQYRAVFVYWKQLEEYEEAGANFTYKLLVKTGSKFQPPYYPDMNKGLGSLNLPEATLDSMHIYIYSYNEKGSSENYSYIYIPAASDTQSLDVKSFSKLAYENGTYELSWHGVRGIDNYTLFWCQHNVSEICNGRTDFKVLKPNSDKHVIDLPSNYRYQFAISANKGIQSSGMIWAKCHISKDEISMFRFSIQFSGHDAPGKNFVKLKWSMNCILKDGIILGYNITYCPVIETSSMCDKTAPNSSQFIGDSKQMFTTIENLEPYKTYQFTMTLITTLGAKRIENNTVVITTLEDTPTIPRNVNITDVGNTSLTVSWDQPEHLNGHISKIKYIIYDNSTNYSDPKKLIEVKYDDEKNHTQRRQVKLDGLHGFTNYTITIEACNEGINSCSSATAPISLRSCIGAPSKLKTPIFKYAPDVLTWEKPDNLGGTIDQYQVRIIRDDNEPDIINTTDLQYPLAQCLGVVKVEKYQVRAVNFDVDGHHGALTDSDRVTLPSRIGDEELMYSGDWSDESTVYCNTGRSLVLVFIIMGLVGLIGAGCGVLKAYKKIRKMKDIKPIFPPGVCPENDENKCPYLYPPEKDEKSDEKLLLPNTKSIPTEIKQKDSNNCGSSDHTDSTGLSDASHGPVDRQNSTSDDDSHSSLHLEIEPIKPNDSSTRQSGESSAVDSESSRESSPYFSDPVFKKNMVTGYVQSVANPASGYVQSAPLPFKNNNPQIAVSQPTSSSYVMAGLPQSAFGIPPPCVTSLPPVPSGYVRAEEAMPMSAMNFPKLGPSPTKVFGSESLPAMPSLPPSSKHGTDSSYIQLTSLDALPSQKPSLVNSMSTKPASSGYVSPEDAVMSKHLKNIMSGHNGGLLNDESAILDPTMSPDAYCRFSWSTDPANDNLHSLLGNSPTINPSKN